MRRLLLIFIISCTVLSKTKPVEKLILGDWYYKKSTINDSIVVQCQFINHHPFKMKFVVCNDKLELKKFPKYIRNQRSGNMFENIKCLTFNIDFQQIQSSFPVGKYKSDSTEIIVFDYGRDKSELNISKISKDTLIVYTNHIYEYKNKEFFAKHLYLRGKTGR